jgi:hypothetical protein
MPTTETGPARLITPSDAESPTVCALPIQKEVDRQLRQAAKEGVSPCNWIPPLWEDLRAGADGRPILPDNSQDLNDFKPLRNAGTQAFLDECAAVPSESFPGEQSNPPNKMWPHPNSDFSHVDPKEFSDEDVEALEARNNAALKKLKEIVGSESQGLRRLARVFEWILWRATVLLNDINNSLDDTVLAAYDSGAQPKTQEKKYNAARDNYIKFLVDLDDREPETKATRVDLRDPKIRSGYGKALQWLCLEPIIVAGRIEEARVVVKWNPHSSSSGIPLPDSPTK